MRAELTQRARSPPERALVQLSNGRLRRGVKCPRSPEQERSPRPPRARHGGTARNSIFCVKNAPRACEGGIIAQNISFVVSGLWVCARGTRAQTHSPETHSPPRAVRRAGAVAAPIHHRAVRRLREPARAEAQRRGQWRERPRGTRGHDAPRTSRSAGASPALWTRRLRFWILFREVVPVVPALVTVWAVERTAAV